VLAPIGAEAQRDNQAVLAHVHAVEQQPHEIEAVQGRGL
jgi:hypothetical protein